VEKVKDRMRRVATALETAGIGYAVVGGNAVQMWVAQIDEAAVRNTRDVDIVLNRSDLPQAIETLAAAGFVFHETINVTMFLDGPDASPRDAVHVIFAGEKVRPEHAQPAPLLDEYERLDNVRTMKLESLVQMKLTSFRLKDRVHLLDMISVGLIDESWPSKFSPELEQRLQELIDNPDA
jgi:hypothetical protein